MEQVNPTRKMELIKKNAQINLAEQGRDLLREKMDALILGSLNIMESVSEIPGGTGGCETIRHSDRFSPLLLLMIPSP